MTLTLNGLRATGIRLLVPWTGAWIADVDVDAELAPSGPATLTIGAQPPLVGTIDDAFSGVFATHARIRVVGGLGWSKFVRAQHYHNDGGVLSSTVLAATASEVRERVVDMAPQPHGVDFVRPAGPASRVLDGRDWFVDPISGTTIAGPRIPRVALPTVEVLEWDPLTRVATLATDELVVPGTMLVDTRFGSLVVVDVEQTWGDAGARATVWCASSAPTATTAGGRLVAALRAVARDAVALPFLRTYRYRVILQGPDGRLTLQIVKRTTGVPDTLPISIAFGVPGVSAKLALSSTVLVSFADGDATHPFVHAFEESTPLEVSIDAVKVSVGEGTSPSVKASPGLVAWIAAVSTATGAPPPTDHLSTKLFTD